MKIMTRGRRGRNRGVVVGQRGHLLGLHLHVEHVLGVELGGLGVAHGRVVHRHDDVVLGQGLTLSSETELGLKLNICSLI